MEELRTSEAISRSRGRASGTPPPVANTKEDSSKTKKKEKKEKKEKKDAAGTPTGGEKKEKKEKRKKEKKDKKLKKEKEKKAPKKPLGLQPVNGEIVISMGELDDMFRNGRTFAIKRFEYPLQMLHPATPPPTPPPQEKLPQQDQKEQQKQQQQQPKATPAQKKPQPPPPEEDEVKAVLQSLNSIQLKRKQVLHIASGAPEDFQVIGVGCYLRVRQEGDGGTFPLCITGLNYGAQQYVLEGHGTTANMVRGRNSRGEFVIIPLTRVIDEPFTADEARTFLIHATKHRTAVPTPQVAEAKRKEFKAHVSKKRKLAGGDVPAGKVMKQEGQKVPVSSDELVLALAVAAAAAVAGEHWRHADPRHAEEALRVAEAELEMALKVAAEGVHSAREAKTKSRQEVVDVEARVRAVQRTVAELERGEAEERSAAEKAVLEAHRTQRVYEDRCANLQQRMPQLEEDQDSEVAARRQDVATLQRHFDTAQQELDAAEDRVLQLKQIHSSGVEQLEKAEDQLFSLHEALTAGYATQAKLAKRLATLQVSSFNIQRQLEQLRETGE